MNLLVLSTWFPYPADNGSRLRAFHLLRELGRRHEIRLVAGLQEDVASSRDEGTVALGAFCREVETFPWRWFRGGPSGGWRSLLSMTPRSILDTDSDEARAMIAAQLRRPTDAVLLLQHNLAPFLPADEAGDLPPMVLDEMEVSGYEQAMRRSRGVARLRHGLTAWKSGRYWHKELRRFRAVTAVSEAEAEAVRRVIGAETPPTVVNPNGVDTGAYRRVHGRAQAGRLVYNGSLSYAPNLEAVRWFASEVLPRVVGQAPEAHLVVTGRNEGLDIDDLRANPRIHLTGFLPDIRPTLDSACLCVVPLRYGGGTRLKILEAWAAELPVVSTVIGAAGLDATDGKHLLLADSAEAIAEAVVRLLREPDRARDLACEARALVEARYDWHSIGADLSRLVEAVVSPGGAVARKGDVG
jgi:glycosyltransferase involved in cell wall biosynthesis